MVKTEKSVAMIGTRDWDKVSNGFIQLYLNAALYYAKAGYTLHTGAAIWSDQEAAEKFLAVEKHLQTGCRVCLYLPWPDYEADWIAYMRHKFGPDCFERITVYNPQKHAEWAESVRKYHPTHGSLKQGAFKLHARNYPIVKGREAVVALPKAIHDTGGTGQGMRVAQALGIPLYNILVDEDRARLSAQISPAAPHFSKYQRPVSVFAGD